MDIVNLHQTMAHYVEASLRFSALFITDTLQRPSALG